MNATPDRLDILIIDDEDDMCWALQRIVEAEGHRCLLARTAREALQILACQSFHLAYVDVKLPDMQGLELIRHMHMQAPALPCVLVSGYFYDDDDPVQAGLKSGAIVGFIGKPFLLTQVQDALRCASCGTSLVGNHSHSGTRLPGGAGRLDAGADERRVPAPFSRRGPLTT